MKNEIFMLEDQNVKLEVNILDETVWLNREQIATLFGRDIKTIGKHINNALKEELDDSVVSKFATTARDGKKYNVEHFNLDMIISIGYRVKSKNGVSFRKWANSVLHDYLIKGYAQNEKRLVYLEKKVKLIDIASRINDKLANTEVGQIIKIINDYSIALNLLDDYDHNSIVKPKSSKIKITKKIEYDECLEIINELKFNNSSGLFALERDRGLEAIIGNVYQSFDDKDVYKSLEEKAANFLYLVTKNHVFIDGNKRIAAALFVYFLNFHDLLYKQNKAIIDNNSLVAITLLIAQSDPKEKEILIDLIINFLNNKERGV